MKQKVTSGNIRVGLMMMAGCLALTGCGGAATAGKVPVIRRGPGGGAADSSSEVDVMTEQAFHAQTLVATAAANLSLVGYTAQSNLKLPACAHSSSTADWEWETGEVKGACGTADQAPGVKVKISAVASATGASQSGMNGIIIQMDRKNSGTRYLYRYANIQSLTAASGQKFLTGKLSVSISKNGDANGATTFDINNFNIILDNAWNVMGYLSPEAVSVNRVSVSGKFKTHIDLTYLDVTTLSSNASGIHLVHGQIHRVSKIKTEDLVLSETGFSTNATHAKTDWKCKFHGVCAWE